MRFWKTDASRARHYADNKPADNVRNAEPVWLDEAHWKRLVCFVHIPKAAGTSFKDILWRVYGRGFLPYHQRLSTYTPESLSAEQARNVLALGGHFSYGFHNAFGPERCPDGIFAGREILYVSIVRKPVDRLLSYFRFVRTFPAHRLHLETKHMGCREFFDHMVKIENGECTSLQCSMLGGQGADSTQAIERAEKAYMAVATVENVATMISALSVQLDWPEVKVVHKNRAPVEKISNKERTFVEAFSAEYCGYDDALYRHVAASPRGIVGTLAARSN